MYEVFVLMTWTTLSFFKFLCGTWTKVKLVHDFDSNYTNNEIGIHFSNDSVIQSVIQSISFHDVQFSWPSICLGLLSLFTLLCNYAMWSTSAKLMKKNDECVLLKSNFEEMRRSFFRQELLLLKKERIKKKMSMSLRLFKRKIIKEKQLSAHCKKSLSVNPEKLTRKIKSLKKGIQKAQIEKQHLKNLLKTNTIECYSKIPERSELTTELKEAMQEIWKLTKERDEAKSKLMATVIELSSVKSELEYKEEKLLLNIQLAQSEIEEYKTKCDQLEHASNSHEIHTTKTSKYQKMMAMLKRRLTGGFLNKSLTISDSSASVLSSSSQSNSAASCPEHQAQNNAEISTVSNSKSNASRDPTGENV